MLFTNYDALLAMNTALIDDVGLWDQNLPWYHSDEDFYRRVTLAGYEAIDTCIDVNHDYSQTIKSDPVLNFLNAQTFDLYRDYYVKKWGGLPDHEKFTMPFNGAMPK